MRIASVLTVSRSRVQMNFLIILQFDVENTKFLEVVNSGKTNL